MFNNLKNKEQEELLPEHIGIIMDGNGRWAKQKGKPRIFGHKAGMDSLKDVAVHGARRGIKGHPSRSWSRGFGRDAARVDGSLAWFQNAPPSLWPGTYGNVL